MPTSPGSCRTTPRDARARPSGGTRPGVSLAVCVSLSWACAAAGATFRFGEIGITVPDGFSVDRVAAPPLVERPVSLAFDEDGRLYVADSSGSSDKLVEQQSDPRHRIFRLVDRDGDGVFDTRTLFADRLMMLQGTLWHRGSLYAASGPQIWRFTDTDGDGVADERSVWFDGKTLTGCGNDMHGPYRGPDGWFYWCKGAFAEQTHDLPGRPGWKTRAAHIFRCPPDRPVREIEPVMTGGMDNPVDVAFSATGERFLSATFLEHPAGGRRDGVIHALYGGVYGKDHGVLDGHARTGDLLPALVHLGPAAACGLHVHSGHGLGDDYAGNLFACSFNLRTVSRHVPVPRGGTFDTRDEPFLSADVADFHPTDVIEDADGSLLVVDTGGWYKLCCPTSQIGKPAVLGGIYRVRRAAGPSSDDPRGRRIDWHALDAAGLTALLADARPAVVERALDLAAQRGPAAVESLARAAAGGGTSRSRRHAVWGLTRIDHPAARAAAVTALADPAPDVRQAAAHAVGLWRDPAGLAGLVRLLDDADAGIVRAAAEALGRLGNAAAVPAVLAACSRADDRALEHSLTYALIEVGRTEPLSAALAAADPRIRRAALVALDQMPPQAGPAVPLERHVIAACRDDDPRVRDAALWIASRHPEWAGPLAAEVGPQVDRAADHPDEAPRITLRLARLAAHPAFADALAASYREGRPTARAVACAVMRAARLKHTPESWVDALAGTLARDADDSLETLAALPLAPEQRQRLRPVVVPLAAGADTAPKRRLLAVQVAGPDAGLPAAVADRLVDMAVSAGPADGGSPLDRSAAVTALVAARPSAASLARLAPALARLPANDVAALLPVCARAGGQPLDAALVAVAGHRDPAALDRAVVATFVDALPEDRRARGRALLARIDAARAGQREAFERLAASLPDGDAARGHLVFASSKAACTTCHAMAHVGGRIGPDLSKIGRIRQPRDLLEAIVLPSASFVRSYEPMAVLTEDGRAFQGIVSDDGATELVLQTSATASERIPRSAIESIEPGTVSLMPKGYDTILSAQELADLVAFLARAK